MMEKGAVRILCEEIEFPFDRRLETPAMLVAFVRVLVWHVDHMRAMQAHLTPVTGKAPSDDSAEVLRRVHAMLDESPESIVSVAAGVHSFIGEVAPDDAYPCDHLIDMLSSCVSALRFGLEYPCHSRHAAAAASHVWKHMYGVRLFDGHTPKWEKDWARAQLHQAILSRVPTPPESESPSRGKGG